MRTKALLAAVTVFVAATAVSFIYSPTRVSAQKEKFRKAERPIPNHYIVVLNDALENRARIVEDRVREHSAGFAMKVDRTFSAAVMGYAAEMTAEEAVRLSSDPSVKYIEEDGEIVEMSVQSNAPWGIARIDQRNGGYPPDTDYAFSATGAGVNVYVLDSGILTTHPDFGGRAVDAVNISGETRPVEECSGHGTHVAGTIGSNTYGVAKGVNLYSVRVFPCWGGSAVSTVIAGVDWVTKNAIQPAVANLSLGGSSSNALNQAVQSSINKGITYVVAAGNSGADACNESPANVGPAITVGMTDDRDYRVDISNFGSCVDIFAPGTGIVSTGNYPLYPYEHSMSGTSTAAPHVAGVAALFLELNPSASPRTVHAAIVDNATTGIVGDPGKGSPNRFLFSGFLLSDPVPPGCAGSSFTGSLSQPGQNNYQSSETGFSTGSGQFEGVLKFVGDGTFVLSLEQKKGRSWGTIASSSGSSNVETVSFKGKSGTYRWRVRSVYGTGGYTLCSITP